MSVSPVPPNLRAFTGALLKADASFIVVGGFAVIANRYVRATKDADVLIPDDADNDHRCLAALRTLAARRARDAAALEDGHLLGAAHLRVITPTAGLTI